MSRAVPASAARSRGVAPHDAAVVKARGRRSESGSVAQPRILAGFVQGTLASLEPASAEAVRARLAAETRDRLAHSSRLAWLPVEIDVELTEAIYDELGAGRAHELFRRNLSAALDSPILRALAHGALRIFGASPERVFGWAPKAYTQILRDAGSMSFEPGEAGVARIELSDLPAVVARSARYLDGVAGSIAAGFDLMGIKGEVRIERIDPERRRAAFLLEWDDGDPRDGLPEPAGA